MYKVTIFTVGKVPLFTSGLSSFEEAAEWVWNNAQAGDDVFVIEEIPSGIVRRYGLKDDLKDMDEWEESWA